MLVRCPKCQTTYKISDELLKGSAPAFRCSRCKHTFELESNSTEDARAEDSSLSDLPVATPSADEELSLPFEAKETAGANGPGEEVSRNRARVEEPDNDH